ncbi:MAG: type II secretion system protein GspJ [Candidatus Binatia bacterium]
MRSRIENLKCQAAFTLIEVVLAMTLLALMVTVLYGAFHLGHRAAEKVQDHIDESQRLRSLGEFLGTYLRSAYPYRPSPRDSAIFFFGDEESLAFVSAVSVGMGGRGMAKISLTLIHGGAEGNVLTLEEEVPVRAQEAGQAAGNRSSIVLQEGVRDLRLDYLDPQSDEERWIEQWDGRERRSLPRAVRIHLRDERGEETQWIFPMMISVLSP